MTLYVMSDYEPVVCYYHRCRLCRLESESFDRERDCPRCGGPTDVFGLQERVVKTSDARTVPG